VHYLEGVHAHPAVPLVLEGTDFQRRVWQALQSIPYGETRSYSDVAGEIGQPAAVRAVARACAANKVALVVPCHRVVPKGAGAGGYRWGMARKQRLLELEVQGRATTSGGAAP
jgi:AraC family transcriptional regulator of adaptative response/methylated-DNA-[protein]-cysteine methyltransferase